MGCLKQNDPILFVKMIYSLPTSDSVRDIALLGDTLYLAADSDQLQIYQINNDTGFTLDSLYTGFVSDEHYEIIQINIDTASRSLFVLDRFDYTYAGAVDFFANDNPLESIDCDQYQSRSTVVNGESPQLLTLFRHLDSVNEIYPISSSIKKISFDAGLLEYSLYDEICPDTAIINLNYDTSDIHYSDSLLIVANPELAQPSFWVYRNTDSDDFQLQNKVDLISKPLTVNMQDQTLFIGLNDDSGCYIALLDSQGGVTDNLTVANGYTIRHIYITENFMILSAGYDGVLVYKWEGGLDLTAHALITSPYAYTAALYDEDKVIIGTKYGLEVYQIEL